MANRLAASASPYLQQHRDNPVDWHEWGPEALDEARRRDLPVLLSVGYAACHWCHVMAHESFEDAETAALMNASFVNIKVDREERPDIDAVYMEATQAMTGQGGWPMTVFLTPSGRPFYAGTYFPPEPRHGMPSFRQLLLGVAEAWRDRRAELERAGEAVVEQLTAHMPAPAGRGTRSVAPPERPAASGDDALRVLADDFDARCGGFGRAPKFPPTLTLEHLLRHHARTGHEQALTMVERTLDAMARGGIYDQLGGGFARYSVDGQWVVPHFEKMLYDNALLLRICTHWWRATGSALAARVAVETGEFLLRDLRTPQGGFASSLDADSEGAEGKFYVWTPAQLVEALGAEDGSWAADVFGVTTEGTFESGASVLQLRQDPDDVRRYGEVRTRLFEARSQRVPPARDDKVVAAWNGLTIAGLAEAGALLGRPDFVQAAVHAAGLLRGAHIDRARLVRVSRDGRPGRHAGVLEDYGDVAEGFLALYAVTGQVSYLVDTAGLLDSVLSRFPDGRGGFYDTADDTEALVRRPQDPTDNVTPSGQSAVAGALLSYAAYTGSPRHRDAAERALALVGTQAERHPRFHGWALAVAEALVDGPREVAVIGAADDPAREALWRTALMGTAPGVVVAVGEPDAGPSVALLAHRPLVEGRAAAYVCRHFTCLAPVTDPAALAAQVDARSHALEEASRH